MGRQTLFTRESERCWKTATLKEERQNWTYTRDPDGTRLNVQVHKVVHHTTLEVVCNTIDDNLAPHVDELDKGEIFLILVNSLVHLFIVLNTFTEVTGGFFGILAGVVGACGLHIKNIAHNEVLIIALGFDEESLDVGGGATLLDPATPVFGGVCRVEYGNGVLGVLEPLDHVGDGGFCGSTAETLPFFVRCVEERGCRGWGIVAAILSHVESAGFNREPCKVATDWHFDHQFCLCWVIAAENRVQWRKIWALTHLSEPGDSCLAQEGRP